jgi:hypothetical protein
MIALLKITRSVGGEAAFVLSGELGKRIIHPRGCRFSDQLT